MYKYLGLPSGAKRLDTRRMYEVSIAKGVRTAGSFYSVMCSGEGFLGKWLFRYIRNKISLNHS